jgi:hypothetical protein
MTFPTLFSQVLGSTQTLEIIVLEIIFNLKNIICDLISKFSQRKLELSIHEPRIIKLVPSLSFVYNFIWLNFI